MTGRDRPRRTDGNGIPRPVIKWRRVDNGKTLLCNGCAFRAGGADLALARLHVKTFPSHEVQVIVTEYVFVWAETTDGVKWAEAVNAL